MLERQIDQHERRAVMRNEQRVREQAEQRRVFAPNQSEPSQSSTYYQHALADAQIPRDRFSAVDAAYVVGSKPDVACAYPAASSAHQTELPPELPTGYCIDELEPLEPLLSSAQGNSPNPACGDVVPSAPLDVEQRDAGLGLSQSGDPAAFRISQRTFNPERDAGSLPAQGNSVSGRILRPSNLAGPDGHTELPPKFRRRV